MLAELKQVREFEETVSNVSPVERVKQSQRSPVAITPTSKRRVEEISTRVLVLYKMYMFYVLSHLQDAITLCHETISTYRKHIHRYRIYLIVANVLFEETLFSCYSGCSVAISGERKKWYDKITGRISAKSRRMSRIENATCGGWMVLR